MGHDHAMKIFDALRRVLTRDPQSHKTDHARRVDEQQQLDQAKAWARKGGPVDPGFSA